MTTVQKKKGTILYDDTTVRSMISTDAVWFGFLVWFGGLFF
jgi:hypothetical protein